MRKSKIVFARIKHLSKDYHFVFSVSVLSAVLIETTVFGTDSFLTDVLFGTFIGSFIGGLFAILTHKPVRKIALKQARELNEIGMLNIKEMVLEPIAAYLVCFTILFAIQVVNIPSWDLFGKILFALFVSGSIAGIFGFVIHTIQKIRYAIRPTIN